METIYANAFTEVYTILGFMPIEYIEKIPSKLLEIFENNRNKEYKYEVDTNKKLKEQQMSIETRAILANLYRDFWCSEETKQQILQKEKNEREEYQKEINDRFSEDNLFKKEELFKRNNIDEKMMIQYKETLLMKIVNKIKKVFHIK